MDFFNKLGKTASKTYQATKEKATNLSEELKIKSKNPHISSYNATVEGTQAFNIKT